MLPIVTGSKKCDISSAASLCGAPEVFEVEQGNSSNLTLSQMHQPCQILPAWLPCGPGTCSVRSQLKPQYPARGVVCAYSTATTPSLMWALPYRALFWRTSSLSKENSWYSMNFYDLVLNDCIQVFCWCPAQSRPGVQASFTWSLMLSSTCCRLGSGCWRGLGMEMDGYWVKLMDATLHWSSHIARWIRLEWIGWWKYVEIIYHLNAPPPHHGTS